MMNRFRLAAVVLAGLGLLAACGGDDSATLPPLTPAPVVTDAPDTTVEVATTTVVATTEAPTTTVEVTTTVEETTTTTTAAPDPGACLVGEWIIDEDQMNAFYDQVTASTEGEVTLTVTGFTGLTFTADGRFAYTPDYTLELEVIGASGSGVATGIVAGTYEVVDGAVVTLMDRNELQLTVNVMGQEFDGSDIAGGLLDAFPLNEAPFDCSGPNPVIDFSTGEGQPRVPVTLTP